MFCTWYWNATWHIVFHRIVTMKNNWMCGYKETIGVKTLSSEFYVLTKQESVLQEDMYTRSWMQLRMHDSSVWRENAETDVETKDPSAHTSNLKLYFSNNMKISVSLFGHNSQTFFSTNKNKQNKWDYWYEKVTVRFTFWEILSGLL